MSRRILLSVALLLSLCASPGSAHDMFLKLKSHFLEPNHDAMLLLFNGTFAKSENSISRDRMIDVSIVGPASQRHHPDPEQWSDKDNATLVDGAGSDVAGSVGVSLRSPHQIGPEKTKNREGYGANGVAWYSFGRPTTAVCGHRSVRRGITIFSRAWPTT